MKYEKGEGPDDWEAQARVENTAKLSESTESACSKPQPQDKLVCWRCGYEMEKNGVMGDFGVNAECTYCCHSTAVAYVLGYWEGHGGL